jgi:gas vesicle protein
MISPKHLATFLMGAAAGAAIMKYNSMTPEEQEKLTGDLKQKAEEAQTEAKQAIAQLQDYFNDLQTKGMDALKTQMGSAEGMIQEFISKMNANADTNANKTA